MRKSFWDRFKDSVLVPATEPNKGKGSAMANDDIDHDEDEGQEEAIAAKPAKKAAKAKKGGKGKAPKEKKKSKEELKAERIRALKKDLPKDDLEALIDNYRAAIVSFDNAVIAGFQPDVDNAEELIEAIELVAESGHSPLGASAWQRRLELRRRVAAPFGERPKWGQAGTFRLQYRGLDCWVHVADENNFYFFAATFDLPFCSGDGEFECYTYKDEPRSGKTVEDFARHLIDDEAPSEDCWQRPDKIWLVDDSYAPDPKKRTMRSDAPLPLREIERGRVLRATDLPDAKALALKMFRLAAAWEKELAARNVKEPVFPVSGDRDRDSFIFALQDDGTPLPVVDYATDRPYFIVDDVQLKRKRMEISSSGHAWPSNSHKVLRYVADPANPGVPADDDLGDEKAILTPDDVGANDPESPGIPFHEYANFFPMMSGKEADEFNANLKREGFRPDERIMLFAGTILDGRNRYRGALNAKFVTPDFRPDFTNGPIDGIFENFDPEIHGEPLAYVISKNLKRRHLNEGQRAMVAGKLANMKRGQPAKAVTKKPKPKKAAAKTPAPAETSIPPIGGISAEKAAEQLNVGIRSVERARVVLEHGAPELQQAVEQGTVAISVAAEIATLPQAEQTEIVARGEKEIVEKAREIGQAKRAVKREKKLEKISAAARGNGPLPKDKRYVVLYADPAWDWETWSEKGTDRTPGYPTATLDQLCALRLGEIAADDAVFFMWATAPKLLDALKLLKDAGFEYVTHAVWDKEWQTTGYWFFGIHEILLVGKRGNIPAPLPGTQEPSIYRERRTTEHSRKPDHYAEMIDRLYPGVPKIELFHRDGSPEREGWDYWGNQSSAAAAPAEGEGLAGSNPTHAIGDEASAPIGAAAEEAREMGLRAGWASFSTGPLNETGNYARIAVFPHGDVWMAGFMVQLGFVEQTSNVDGRFGAFAEAVTAARTAMRDTIEPMRSGKPEIVGQVLRWLDDDSHFTAEKATAREEAEAPAEAAE